MQMRSVYLLILLDFSKAFDRVNHDILLEKMKRLGFGDSTCFFRSYLESRTQQVRVGNTLSTKLQVMRGVPQESVLGPLLYSVYTCDLPRVVKYSSVVMFADDVQLLFRYRDAKEIQNLKLDLSAVENWVLENELVLNPGKSKAIHFGKGEPINPSLLIGGNAIPFVESARNLGVVIDKNLRFEKHISAVVRNARWKLTKLNKISRLVSTEKLKRIVEACVVYPMLYSSAVWGTRILAVEKRRLQLVQNWAVKLVEKKSKYDHCSYLFEKHKWARIMQLVALKIACLTRSALRGDFGEGMRRMFHMFDHQYSTREKGSRFILPKVKGAGQDSFSFMGARTCNKLPISQAKTGKSYRREMLAHIRKHSLFEVYL